MPLNIGWRAVLALDGPATAALLSFWRAFFTALPESPRPPREARAPRLNVSALYQMDVGRHKKDGVLKAARNQAGL